MSVAKRRNPLLSWRRMVGPAVLVAGAVPAGATAAEQSADRAKFGALDEIVVTAQKREERLQDVPLPVTALDADALLEKNAVRLQDYYAQVPSLNVLSQGNGQTQLIIRGINTGGSANPAFGVIIDDVPYGSSSAYGYGDRLVPDIDPNDLQRVEVLRGPQGTLYGAASIGGLLKFVTKDPALDEFRGRVQADFSSVSHGDTGYGVRGGVSFPLITDRLGVSLSGYKRKDAGFIDDASRNLEDVNSVDYKGGRVALLWKLSDALSLRLSALAQNTDGDGTAAVQADVNLQPTNGELQNSLPPGVGNFELRARAYSATIKASLGDYTFTSLSGYGTNEYFAPLRFVSPFWSSLSQSFFGVDGNKIVNEFKTKKFSQEFRLESPTGGKVDWMVGAFYVDEDTPVTQSIAASNAATGVVAGSLLAFNFPTQYTEHAGFGNVTVHFTDRFDTQVGVRYSKNRQTYDETDSGAAAQLFFGAPTFVFDRQRSKDSATTYHLTPRFTISPDLMLYARFSSGYRPGGNNGEATAFNLPLTFKPDKTVNYEFGVKGSLFDRRMTFETSIYYIDWKDVQVAQTDPVSGLVFFTNGGKAKSQGFELALAAAPADGLSLQANAAFGDAKLKGALPLAAGVGLSGDRMPNSAKFTGSVSADYEFALGQNLTGFLGGTVSHVGSRPGQFVNPQSRSPLVPGVRLTLPSYTTVGLRAGLRLDTWTFNVYAENLTDEVGLLYANSRIQGSARPTDPYTYTPIRPRMLGVSIAKTF